MIRKIPEPRRSHPNLRQLREKLGFSQDELGFRSTVAQSRISRAERGYLWLSSEERERVASALGVAIEELDTEASTRLAS